MKKIEVMGLQTIPEIKAGDELVRVIIDCARNEAVEICEKDVVVLTSKIVSKAMDLTVKLDDVKATPRAEKIGKKTGKDPRLIQLVWDAGQEIIVMLPLEGMIKEAIINASEDADEGERLRGRERLLCISADRAGRIYTSDGGVDGSNHEAGTLSFVPPEPDEVAEAIREEIKEITGSDVAVIIADTEMIPYGTMDFAIGCSGIAPRAKEFGRRDSFGRPKFGGMDLVANEMTSACALVFGQNNAKIPVAIVRGYEYEFDETASICRDVLPNADSGEVRSIVRQTLRATSYTRGFMQGILMRIASWFI
jgi:coenzyme F420-0:L-glutamate ligase/coenzyme F420-1:gamma-L-glutamate ligase